MLAAAGVGIAGVQLLEPILFGHVIDALTQRGSMAKSLILWSGLGIFNAIASVFLAVMADRLAHRNRLSALAQAFDHTIKRPHHFHLNRGSGKLVRTILIGSDQLFMLWLSFFREHLSSFVSVLFLVPIAITMNPKLASLLFVLAAIYTVANTFIISRTHARQAEVETHHQEIAGRLTDVVSNVSIVQSYVRFQEEKVALQDHIRTLLRAQYPVLTWWGILSVITRVSSTLALMTIVGVGSFLVAKMEITPGDVVTFAGFSTLLISRLDQLSGFLARAVSQAPALRNLFELMDPDKSMQKEEPKDTVRPLNSTALKGCVVFDNVSFRYPGRTSGVSRLSFRVKPGQSVALVGPSGSGKTTCLSLLQRVYDPDSGRIVVDGRDLSDCSTTAVRESIGAVFQEAGLFNRSILENIRVGRPNATLEEVIHAAKRAEAHEFIVAKPGGYDYVVGERGLGLSGGERQRIAIARAILKDAPILIFDEATSALDNETEQKIQLALEHLRESKTTFSIAHRLSTIANSDLILVFDQGEIVEAGTFDELAANGGMFSRLLQAGQMKTHGETTATGPVLEPAL